MTPSLPLTLHYEVPDRAAPWAQAFTARLEAIARAARVPLVAYTSAADLTPSTRTVHVRLTHPWPRESSRPPTHSPLTATHGELDHTPDNHPWPRESSRPPTHSPLTATPGELDHTPANHPWPRDLSRPRTHSPLTATHGELDHTPDNHPWPRDLSRPSIHHLPFEATLGQLDHTPDNHPWPRDLSRPTTHHLPFEATLGQLRLTPADQGSETERALALTDLAALLLDLARLPDNDRHDHPLLQLPAGHYLAHLEARPELVPDLAGALTRHTLAQLAAHLRALMDRPAPIDPEAGRRAPSPPTMGDDPEPALLTLAEEHHAATRRALTDLERHVDHALTTHGLAAIEPLLEHLTRLERHAQPAHPAHRADIPLARRAPIPNHSPELELEAAEKALARAKASAQSLPRPLPRQLALVGVHAPLVAAFGAMALAPLVSSLTSPADPHTLAGATALGLFAFGGTLANTLQRLAHTRAERRIARAQDDLELARRHRVANTLATHAELLEHAATRRYLDGLAQLRARLGPIARKVHALSTAYPRGTATDALVTALAPPVEPWVQAIHDELAATNSNPTYHPPTLLALEERVAAVVAERARWQGRADVSTSLEGPATTALATLATRLDTRLPRSAPAHRFALFPRPLTARGHRDELAAFTLVPSHAGLYALALTPFAQNPLAQAHDHDGGPS